MPSACFLPPEGAVFPIPEKCLQKLDATTKPHPVSTRLRIFFAFGRIFRPTERGFLAG
jgi:hypothetical protein